MQQRLHERVAEKATTQMGCLGAEDPDACSAAPLARARFRAIANHADEPQARPLSARPITRRNFIVWYLAGLLTATVVAGLAPILVYIWPPQGNTKAVDLKVNLPKPINEVADGDGVKFDAPKASAFTMVDGGGDNSAGDYAFGGFLVKAGGKTNVFAVNCSHLGCSIALNKGANRFECPCHGSQFHLDGTVLHGPAVAPLSHLDWKPGDTPDTITVKGVSLPGYG